MFLRIVLLIILMSSSFAFADELTSSELELQTKLEALQRSAQAAATTNMNEVDAYRKATSNYAQSFSSSLSSTGSDLYNGAANILARTKDGIAKFFAPESAESAIEAGSVAQQKANLDKINAAQAKADAASRAAEGGLSKALSASAASIAATRQAISNTTSAASTATYNKMKEKSMDTWISVVGLQGDMSTISRSFNDLNEARILLERKLDHSIMGNYLQQKMTKLLNSDAFCKAASSPSCQKGKNTSAFKASDLKSVFPSNPESNYSSSASSTATATKAKQ